MILSWIDISCEQPRPGQVALTYHASRPGPIPYDVLIWCKGLGKDPKKGAFGRMKFGKRSATVEHIVPEPTHWAPLNADVNKP